MGLYDSVDGALQSKVGARCECRREECAVRVCDQKALCGDVRVAELFGPANYGECAVGDQRVFKIFGGAAEAEERARVSAERADGEDFEGRARADGDQTPR